MRVLQETTEQERSNKDLLNFERRMTAALLRVKEENRRREMHSGSLIGYTNFTRRNKRFWSSAVKTFMSQAENYNSNSLRRFSIRRYNLS